jgi:hypothetical protein
MLLEKIQWSECSVNESVFPSLVLSAKTNILLFLNIVGCLYEIYQYWKGVKVGFAMDEAPMTIDIIFQDISWPHYEPIVICQSRQLSRAPSSKSFPCTSENLQLIWTSVIGNYTRSTIIWQHSPRSTAWISINDWISTIPRQILLKKGKEY